VIELDSEKEKKINEHEPQHRRAYAAIYDALTTESIDELAKMIRERYPQVTMATPQRRCHWKDEGVCSDAKCDSNPCNDSYDTILLTLRKSS
jgi:hypothetical protein